ncbi:inactive serine protease PAMR1-like isoform X1 [Polyodon spathula]|uniref:inactive serine protease PAMR1-like isoform X1 n=1 Tax=Polyodon spathula TaxID=7913 RepID=UPI001B7E19A9|nr:inactive serine protease PAMR1-like isoform X1 [Polyodon spathula]
MLSPAQESALSWRLALGVIHRTVLLLMVIQGSALQHAYTVINENCPGAEWNIMCRGCCEYGQISCKCPSQGEVVGYAVPCCRNAENECDPCIFHPGCSIFENCKHCHNGTWATRDDFFIKGKYCSECRRGWSGGGCMKCGGVINAPRGEIVLESYPINAHCEWTVNVDPKFTIHLRFIMLSLEFDYSCRYDYVEIRDGDSIDSRVIGRFCGNGRPATIRSTGSSLHILFESDGYKSFDGFHITFEENSACLSSPCLHDGTCLLDTALSFRCACLAGYTGKQCENMVMCRTPPVPVNGMREGNDLRFGGQVTFRCDPGFTLIGTPMATCQLDGTWSTEPPRCVPEKKQCADPGRPLNGFHLLVFGPGDTLIAVQFFCNSSYTLSGNVQRTCQPEGTWSGTQPQCVKVPEKKQCGDPGRPLHGFYLLALGSGGEPIGARFFCNNSYSLSGNAQRTCQPDGTWSGKLPQCIRACREPKVSDLVRQKVLAPQLPFRNTPLHKLYSSSPTLAKHQKQVLPSKAPPVLEELAPGFHHVYTQLQYECTSPFYQHTGSTRRICLKTGKWSGRHATCLPVCGKLPNFNLQKLADTQWPWLAAVYRRSATGFKDESIKQDTWQLICSGALINQRSVLVAAHCVTELGKLNVIKAADIRVLVGKHHQSDTKELKSQQQLQISAILVHPNYDPLVLDSDLALLKLLDKARLSEKVQPACLPGSHNGEGTEPQGFVTGWSILSHENETVRVGAIELGDAVACESQYAQNGISVSVSDNMFCAKEHPHGFSNICPSDTGGIAVVRATSSSSPGGQQQSGVVWRLLGLVSWGYEQACTPGLYTAYTRVASFKDWIEKNMK